MQRVPALHFGRNLDVSEFPESQFLWFWEPDNGHLLENCNTRDRISRWLSPLLIVRVVVQFNHFSSILKSQGLVSKSELGQQQRKKNPWESCSNSWLAKALMDDHSSLKGVLWQKPAPKSSRGFGQNSIKVMKTKSGTKRPKLNRKFCPSYFCAAAAGCWWGGWLESAEQLAASHPKQCHQAVVCVLMQLYCNFTILQVCNFTILSFCNFKK